MEEEEKKEEERLLHSNLVSGWWYVRVPPLIFICVHSHPFRMKECSMQAGLPTNLFPNFNNLRRITSNLYSVAIFILSPLVFVLILPMSFPQGGEQDTQIERSLSPKMTPPSKTLKISASRWRTYFCLTTRFQPSPRGTPPSSLRHLPIHLQSTLWIITDLR